MNTESRLAASPWHRSLRWRLVVVSLVAILATVWLAHSVFTQLFERHVTAQFQANLRITLDQLAAAVRAEGRPLRIAVNEPRGDPRWSTPYSGMYWQINAPEAMMPGGVQRSRSLWDYTLALPHDALLNGAIHVHDIEGPNGRRVMALERTVTLSDVPEPIRVRLIAAADIQVLQAAVNAFNRTVFQYLLALAVVLAAVLGAQVTIGLAPLRGLHRALTRLRQGSAEQLEGEFPSEIQPLATSFNSILSEHRRHVERARTLAGNLAHAVKTPLTVMANAATDPAVAPQSLRDTITTYTALAQNQVNWHMKRARMAATVVAPGVLVEVRPVIEGIVAVMQRAYAEKSLRLEINVPPSGPRFKGESQDLQEILGNVIENACKWAQQRVRIGQETVAAGLALIVEDDGPGVPSEHYSAVLRRGIRADEMVPGSGLGLAIVSDLLDLYGGHLALERSALGGLAVRIALPMEDVDHLHP